MLSTGLATFHSLSASGRAKAWEWAALAGVVLAAALLRLPWLDHVPTGFQFDEAYNALDALRVAGGARPIFLPANAGREVLYTYLQAFLVMMLGSQVWVFRLASALAGIATIPLIYLLARTILPRRGQSVGLLSAAIMAFSYWHLHFSRYGIRAIILPPLMILTVVAFWKGLEGRGRAGEGQKRDGQSRAEAGEEETLASFRWPAFVLSGLLLGAAVYTHPASRFIPLVLAGYATWLAWVDRRRRFHSLAGLALTVTVALVLSLPMARFFWLNRVALLGHPSDVSILSTRVNQGNVAGALLGNAFRVAGMFVWRGDEYWTHNLAGRPVFDPLLGAAFLLGLGLSLVWVVRWPRNPGAAPFVLILIWLAIMLLPTLVSDQAPNFSRAIGAIPAVFVIAALGLDWVLEQVSRWLKPQLQNWAKPAAWLVILAAIGVSAGLTFHDYFGTFAASPQAYYDFDQDKIDAVAFLRGKSADHTTYLAPLWMTQATVGFAARDLGLRSFEPSNTLVLPPRSAGRSALYAVPAEQVPQIAALGARLGNAAVREDVSDRYGRPLLAVFRLPVESLPDPPDAPFGDLPLVPQVGLEADFSPQDGREQGEQAGPPLQLIGYTPDAEVPAGEAPGLTLYWRALQPMSRNYTIFAHLVDEAGHRWGQADSEPGGSGYRTSAWVPGELIVDRVVPALDRCTPPGTYRWSVGAYDLGSGERLLVQGNNGGQPFSGLNALDLEPVQIGPAGLPAGSSKPQHRLDDVPVPGASGSAAQLTGYDGGPWALRPGDHLPITFYWQQSDQPSPAGAQLQLVDRDGAAVPLGLAPLPSPAASAPGDQIACMALRPRLPTDLAGGDYRLRLSQPTGDPIDLGQVTVQARERSFQVPQVGVPVGQELEGQVRLLGYDTSYDASASALEVRLQWQAIRELGTGYTVFVHVLDDEGRLRAQHDGPPVDGDWPTTSWMPGEVVTDEHTVAIPAGVPAGRYTLAVGMYDPRTLRRLGGKPVLLPGAADVG